MSASGAILLCGYMSMLSCTDHPTMRREYRSSTAATYSLPSTVQMQVNSATHFGFGPSACNSRSSTLSVKALRTPRSLGRPRRRGVARSACSHEPLDAVQATGLGLLQHVLPHAACAVGTVRCERSSGAPAHPSTSLLRLRRLRGRVRPDARAHRDKILAIATPWCKCEEL
jgi:hypothetical protein